MPRKVPLRVVSIPARIVENRPSPLHVCPTKHLLLTAQTKGAGRHVALHFLEDTSDHSQKVLVAASCEQNL